MAVSACTWAALLGDSLINFEHTQVQQNELLLLLLLLLPLPLPLLLLQEGKRREIQACICTALLITA
jgi:hypothetical protein